MFKLNQQVFDIRYGWGVVSQMNSCIEVKFFKDTVYYTLDGKSSKNHLVSTLSDREYKLAYDEK